MNQLKLKLSTLKSNILKTVLTLCLLMTACSSIHSQDTSKIIITSEQLRTTNLIFAEHREYKQMIPLLKQENQNLQLVNQTWTRTDSLKNIQLYQKDMLISQQKIDISRLKKTTTIVGSAAGVSIVITVLCLLLK